MIEFEKLEKKIDGVEFRIELKRRVVEYLKGQVERVEHARDMRGRYAHARRALTRSDRVDASAASARHKQHREHLIVLEFD